MVSVGRKIFFAFLTGLLVSFCYVAGSSLDQWDSLDMTDGSFYLKWIVTAFLAALVVYGVFEALRRLEDTPGEGKPDEKVPKFRTPIYMGIMLLCWLPVFLSIFPGAFSYDALEEWRQVRDGALTAHHPLIHVLALGGLVEGAHALTGSYNAGIAIYTVLQMLLLSWLLALSIRKAGDLGLGRKLRGFSLAFFGLSPVVQLFSVSATKDVIFSAVELLFFLYILTLFCRREAFFASGKEQAGLVLSAFFTMILRNNGVYIVLGMALIAAFFCKKYWRRAAVLLIAVLVPYLVYIGPVHALLSVEKGGVEEMLSVPLQQMARVYCYDRDTLSQEDVDCLLMMVPLESLQGYRATVSDFVKKDFNREAYAAHKREFWKLWAKWGLEHPLTYVNSFLINTVDFWYPHAVVDGYRHADARSSYFDFQVDEPGTERTLLKGVHSYYESIAHDPSAQRLPLAFLALSPGWYMMLTFCFFLYFWCCRRYKLTAAMMVFVLHFATVLLGPVALVRYVLVFFYAFPLCVGIVLKGKGLE